jgi:hypothetical protein
MYFQRVTRSLLTWLQSNVLCQGAYRTFSAGCSWNPVLRALYEAPCGSGCWSNGYFPNKVEFIPHQSQGCLGEGCLEPLALGPAPPETAGIHFGWIAPTMGLRSDTARFTIVFEQPAYKAQTDTKGDGQLPHRPFAVFIGLDNPSPYIRRVGFHDHLLHRFRPESLPPCCIQSK